MFPEHCKGALPMQAFNPYLPSWEYIPDGEPHIFDGRLYVYGSHDRFRGHVFCLNDYVCWSAPVDDLSDWRYEGVIKRRTTRIIPSAGPASMRRMSPGAPTAGFTCTTCWTRKTPSLSPSVISRPANMNSTAMFMTRKATSSVTVPGTNRSLIRVSLRRTAKPGFIPASAPPSIPPATGRCARCSARIC